MIKTVRILSIILLGLSILVSACNKDDSSAKSDDLAIGLEADLKLPGDGDFEKIITKPLVKIDGCKYIVEGTIEYYKNAQLLAIIDFGEGICDNIATKTLEGETIEFNLDKTGGKPDYKKVVVEPLVKIDGCDYIVSGIIKFYIKDKWIATLDFGDGECDEWASKTWDGGSEVISLAKN